jgi:uncharacterized repeat protein (TIGR03803 family)
MKRIINGLGKPSWGKKIYAALMLCAVATAALHAQTLTTLHSFDGTDGTGTVAVLVQGTDGNLYGTASAGGANGYGTVFKMTPSGTLTTLYNFCPVAGCTDGGDPKGALVQAPNGAFYGTTFIGGANGLGTLFKITASGTLTTLHSFDGTDGAYPQAGLILATNGDFYGTTCGDWCFNASNIPSVPGTVFKITPSGALTTLHSFCSLSDCTDGFFPVAGLVQATNGDFYGTTIYGGDTYMGACFPGCGTVFKVTPTGTLTTLYNFCSLSVCADGLFPEAGLVQATNGNLYGTSSGNGDNYDGTVFKITPSGALTTLHTFDGTDGAYPQAGLVQGTDGNFYGAMNQGGANSDGTLFKITPSGALTTLHNFDGTDGKGPYAGLTQATNGNFYGTTTLGGENGYGIAFSLSIGLGPFVETEPTFGKVGAAVKILGTGLTGATSLSFNGTAAVFTVVSSSEITTTVPTGATTGKVKVVTPGGALSSNVPFRVP